MGSVMATDNGTGVYAPRDALAAAPPHAIMLGRALRSQIAFARSRCGLMRPEIGDFEMPPRGCGAVDAATCKVLLLVAVDYVLPWCLSWGCWLAGSLV